VRRAHALNHSLNSFDTDSPTNSGGLSWFCWLSLSLQHTENRQCAGTYSNLQIGLHKRLLNSTPCKLSVTFGSASDLGVHNLRFPSDY